MKPSPRRLSRPSRPTRAALLCVCIGCVCLWLMGCGSVYRQHVERGQQAMSGGRFDEALSAYEAALALEPQGQEARQGVVDAKNKLLEALANSARTKLSMRDFAGAIADARQIQTRITPPTAQSQDTVNEVATTSLLYANKLMREGDPEGSLNLYEMIGRDLPSHAPEAHRGADDARAALAQLLATQAKADLDSGRFQAALEKLDRAISMVPPPKQPPLQTQRLEVARAWAADWEKKAQAAHKASDFAAALSALDAAHALLPLSERAPIEAQQIKVRRDWFDSLIKQAQAKRKDKDFPQAVALSEQAAALLSPPDNAPATKLRDDSNRDWAADLAKQADAETRAGRYPEAFALIDQALQKTLTDEQAPYLQKRTDIGRTWSKNLVAAAEADAQAKRWTDADAKLVQASQVLPETERAPIDALRIDLSRRWASDLTRQGDTALAANNHEEALRLYQEALTHQPPAERAEIDQRITNAQLAWSSSFEQQAQDLIRTKDFLGALKYYDAALERAPATHRAQLEARRQDIFRLWADEFIAQANASAAQTRYPDALAKLDEARRTLPATEHVRLNAASERIQLTWADALAENARALSRQGLTGAAFASSIHAAEVSPPANRATYESQSAQLRRDLLDNTQFVALLRGASLTRDEFQILDAEIARRRGPARLAVSATSAPANATTSDLNISLPPVAFQENTTHADTTVNFQSGTVRSDNPTHAVLLQQLQASQTAASEIDLAYQQEVATHKALTEREKLLAHVKAPPAPALPPVPGAPADPPLDTIEQIQALLKQTRSDLKELDRRLDATRARLKTQQDDAARLERELQKNPPTLEQTQNSALTYRVTTHTLRATLNFSASLGNQRADRTLSRDFTDTTHPAQPAINLPADPLDLPTRDQITSTLRSEALALLPDLVMLGFEQHRRDLTSRAQSARSDAERLHLLVLCALLNPQDTSLINPADIDRLSGLPNTLSFLLR